MKRLLKIIKECHKTRKEEHFSFFRSYHYTFVSKKIKCTGICLVSRKSVIRLKKKSKITVKGSLRICNSFADVIVGSTLILHEGASITCSGDMRLCGACLQLWPKAVFETGTIKVNALTKINIEKKATFGENIVIARCSYITDTNSHDIIIDGESISRQKDITFGNNVWIGSNCNLLRGVSLGDNVVIAANTTLSDKVESNTLVRCDNKLIKKNIDKFEYYIK